ncbi:malto-oligosyltrehalose synthase [Marinilabiliaceae bacterium ANBcel2]|nr:malto-oligosyltrehalose synthase [Marinilabiliaceae bacterium ANBcel2]
MYNPVSTYRLQFNKTFTFQDALDQADYLNLLCAGAIYASPIFTAKPGSMHGYDIIDPTTIDSEIGDEQQFQQLISELKKRRIGWIQDIVPNHMSYSPLNPWINDLLEKGPYSVYSSWFDIDWESESGDGRLLVPFLGEPTYDAVIKGDLTLQWHEKQFTISYFDDHYPVRFSTFKFLMEKFADSLPNSLAQLINSFDAFSQEPSREFLGKGYEKFKSKLDSLTSNDIEVVSFMQNIAREISSQPDVLKYIIDNQFYKLVNWRTTEKEISYRRFFTVNDLICLQMDHRDLFDKYHSTIANWLKKQWIDGLRVDHVDGLYKPVEYLKRLRKLAGGTKYIVVEKILEEGENLRKKWPVQGTSGYDFLATVNNLFTKENSTKELVETYTGLTGDKKAPEQVIKESKRFVLEKRMGGELNNLTDLFIKSELLNKDILDGFERKYIKDTLATFLLAAPVYRIYFEKLPLKKSNRALLQKLFYDARKINPDVTELLNLLEKLFLDGDLEDERRNSAAVKFLRRIMQFTGPLMAKGVEDTTMYRYNAFITHNEVGDTPVATGISTDQFHRFMQSRFKKWPLTMNTTSTHDTKRGEDVRARLNVLSELTDEWSSLVENWIELNRPFKLVVNGKEAPSLTEEYFIYQTLIGILPFNQKITDGFLGRIEEYFIKALREAKDNSNWSSPDKKYEEAVLNFISNILDVRHSFLNSFLPFQDKVAGYGIFNSLSQLVLKTTCPGIPDIYQGTELWDLTLVDPDNRRHVDYALRNILLRSMIDRQMRDPEVFLDGLMNERENGYIKLWLTHRMLHYRKENSHLFMYGEYIPLTVKGKYQNHILAFARHYNRSWHVTIVPVFLVSLNKSADDVVPPGELDWKDTSVLLPKEAPDDWENIFTGEEHCFQGVINVERAFRNSPAGILHAEQKRGGRSAGVLMHVTSLPGSFASGDFGSQAFSFIDILKSSGHSYWQVLPFTQTASENGWSPYSSPSAFAGNIMLISPEQLANEGLISRKELDRWRRKSGMEADFQEALSIREEITSKAWFSFRQKKLEKPIKRFRDFCEKESYWLDDYALFLLFKELFDNKPWTSWPVKIKKRVKETLDRYRNEYKERLDLYKFRQYIFASQWKSLKRYANYHDIKIIGDVSIYVTHDNADVWANPHLFKLNKEQLPLVTGGVPPDYFSETGQIWDMPVYDWEAMEQDGFKWWIARIKRNIELFDVVRLDHFRGFESCYEIPYGDKTAENGEWVQVPGYQLFSALRDYYPKLPFIAEDLGDIDQEVYDLRDEYDLPGMQILQFAFNDDTGASIHSPHNYNYNSVVYTGTHDNNTARGWFKEELEKEGKNRIQLYTGIKPRASNIHDLFMRMAWASPATLSVIPVQDLLGLGSKTQMNKPSIAHGNWTMRLKELPADKEFITKVRAALKIFGRCD